MNKRQRWDMPKDVWEELQAHNLHAAYEQRPPYQRNDYIGWINSAKRPETRSKRIKQMISELEAGDVYMKMPLKKESPKKKKAETLEEYIAVTGSSFAEVLKAIDRCLKSVNPGFESKQAWGGWAYLSQQNYSCMSVRYKDHVKLMIWRGVMLDDPKKVLKGSGTNTRHLRFDGVDQVDCDYLKLLIQQQHELYDQGLRWED